MKQSKIFLGATTCCLAIAAIAAAKIQKSFIQATRYYCTSGETHAKCVPFATPLASCQINGTTFTCYYYTKPSSPTTSRKYILYTNMGNSNTPTCGQTLNCKNKVLYDVLFQ